MNTPTAAQRAVDRRGLAVLLLCGGLPVLSGTALAVVLPAVAADLQDSAAAAAAVVAAYFVAQLAVQPFAGVLADAIGAPRTASWGLWLLAGGSLAAACSPALVPLLAARAAQAAGVALILPSVHAALSAERAERTNRMAWLVTASNLTAAAGPLFGGFVAAHTGWRGIFVVTAVLSAAAAACLAWRPLPDGQQAAITRPASVSALGSRRQTHAMSLNAIDNMIVQALLIGLPFAVATTRLSPVRAVGLLAVVGALAAPLGARLADRTCRASVARAGFATTMIGLLGLHHALSTANAHATLAALCVVGLGLGLEVPSIQSAPLALASPQQRATAAGLAATARQIGSLCGALLAVAVVGVNPAVAFLVCAIAAGGAIVLCSALPGTRALGPAIP